jgi:hypothetical protein
MPIGLDLFHNWYRPHGFRYQHRLSTRSRNERKQPACSGPARHEADLVHSGADCSGSRVHGRDIRRPGAEFGLANVESGDRPPDQHPLNLARPLDPARVGNGTRTGPHAGRTPDNAPGKPQAGRCRTDTAVSRPGQTLAPPMSGSPPPWHPVCGHHIRAAHPGNAESLKAPHRQGDARSRAPPAGRPGHGRPRPTRRQIRRLGPEPRHKALKVNQRGRIPADIVAPPLARRRPGSGPAQRTPRSLSGHPRRPGGSRPHCQGLCGLPPPRSPSRTCRASSVSTVRSASDSP